MTKQSDYIDVDTEILRQEFGSYFQVMLSASKPDEITTYFVKECLGKKIENPDQTKTRNFDSLTEAMEEAKNLTKTQNEEAYLRLKKESKSIHNSIAIFKYKSGLVGDKTKEERIGEKLNELSQLEEYLKKPIEVRTEMLPKSFSIYAHYPQLGQKIYCVNLCALPKKPFEETEVVSRHIYHLYDEKPVISIHLKPGHYQYNIDTHNALKFDGDKFSTNSDIYYFVDKEKAFEFLREKVSEIHQKVENVISAAKPKKRM